MWLCSAAEGDFELLWTRRAILLGHDFFWVLCCAVACLILVIGAGIKRAPLRLRLLLRLLLLQVLLWRRQQRRRLLCVARQKLLARGRHGLRLRRSS